MIPSAGDTNAAMPPKKLKSITAGTAVTTKIFAGRAKTETEFPQKIRNGKTKICAAAEAAAASRIPQNFGKNQKNFWKSEASKISPKVAAKESCKPRSNLKYIGFIKTM